MMENGDKIILDLCGGTGAWSKPYKDAGYKTIIVTLPEYDVMESCVTNHSTGRYLSLQRQPGNRLTSIPLERIHGILAAPPCTEFSLAKNDRPRRFDEGMVLVKACLDVIWNVRYDKKLCFWAMENPRGFLRQFIGAPALTFQQWEFGDSGIKPTDLWGYFKKPKKNATQRPQSMTNKFPNGRINAKGWSRSSEKRAITPPGFAKAFFEANP